MKRKIIFVLLSTLFPLQVMAENITCGVVVPLTGGLASLGNSIKNSIQLASEKFDKEKHVSFLFEDDQYLPKNTTSAVTKFTQVDRVQCLIVFGSTPSIAVSDLAEKAKVR